MKLFRILAIAGIAASATACGDLEVVNLNDPDRERAVSTPSDVESLISGSFSSWFSGGHYNGGGIAMSTMADAHTSSWGNFGMRDLSSEPRVAYNNDPSYSYRYAGKDPWRYSYRALAGIRDGLLAIENGVEVGTAGRDTHRAKTFATFVQGLALGMLANTYDQSFVITETTSLDDPNNLPQLQPYTEVLAASLAKLDEAISLAGQASFDIPPGWIGDGGDMDNTRLAQLAHAYKARIIASNPRTKAERDALDWGGILSEVNAAHKNGPDFDMFSDDVNWAWDRLKVHAGANDGWARVDLEMVGPADASGNFQAWKALTPELRQPFEIDTDDRRVTGTAGPQADGTLVRWVTALAFRPERGTYHFSNYSDNRWYDYYRADYVGVGGEFPVKELDYLAAEAHFRGGNTQAAVDLINKYRVGANLPAVTAAGVSGARCVPKTATGACADLWQTLKYEKRIEVWHYGYGVEFFDDRGWGDLSSNTMIHFPVPGDELDLLLMEIYSFGGGGEGSAPKILTDAFDPETTKWKRDALDAFDAASQTGRRVGVIH